MDGWLDGINRWTDRWDGWMHRWMGEWDDGWVDGMDVEGRLGSIGVFTCLEVESAGPPPLCPFTGEHCLIL